MSTLVDSETQAKTPLSPEERRTLIGGMISMFIDSIDVYLPAFVLPAVMGYFEPPSMSPALKVTLVTLIFAVALLGRPAGSPIFGHFSDKIGRKRITMISAAGYTFITFLIAIMPGYAQWGLVPIYLLIILRLVDGMFLAGGYAAPIPLALERSPKWMRGRVSGLVSAAAPAAIFLINLMQVSVIAKIPKSVFIVWGWRIPFFVAVILGIVYMIYYSRIPEIDLTYLRSKDKAPRQPLFELFSGGNFRTLAQVFLLSIGYWIAAQMTVSFLPSLLIGILHQSPKNVGMMYLVVTPLALIAMILYGMLSDKVGRRPVLIWTGVGTIVVVTLTFYFMIQMAHHGVAFFWIGLMVLIGQVVMNGPLSVFIVYLNERFPVQVRSTGYSVSYTFGLILPGLYSIWLLLLSHIMPYAYTEMVLTVLGGVVLLCGSLLGPETQNVEMLGRGAG